MTKIHFWRIVGLGSIKIDPNQPETINLNDYITDLGKYEPLRKDQITIPTGNIHYPKPGRAELKTMHMTAKIIKLNLDSKLSYEIRFIYDYNKKNLRPKGHHWNMEISRFVEGSKDRKFKFEKKKLPHIAIPGHEKPTYPHIVTGENIPGVVFHVINGNGESLAVGRFY